jgi:glyoxylase-like metal-dependent hydrolase (beta-lactamase superfamily II)
MKLFSIEGNKQKLDGGAMFGHVPKVLWSKWADPDELGRINLSCRCLLLDTGDKKILFEAGVGAFFPPKMAERFGVQSSDEHLLLKNLKKIGIEPQDIDIVILSHLHFDHVGGILPTYKQISEGNDELVFNNATYIVGKEAFARAKNPHLRDKASFIADIPNKLEKSKRLQLIDKDFVLEKEGISFLESNGHTPGQLHSLISGKNKKVLFCGDLIPGKWWLNIAIGMGYDRFPEKLSDEKKLILHRAAKENWGLFFTHDPSCSMAEIKFEQKEKIIATNSFSNLYDYKI